jgi:hypothetical protein
VRSREAQAALAGAGSRSDRYTRSLVEHETTSAERDLEWVDSLIAQELSELQVHGGTQ